MTKKEFNELSFDEVMQRLYNDGAGDITSIDILKDFIKEKIDNEDYYIAIPLLQAINEDTQGSYYWDYDYSMGTLDTPTPIRSKEDIEHLIED